MSAADPAAVKAQHVLYAFSAGPLELRVQAGSFTRQLIALIQAADGRNRARLSLGFPEYVRLVHAMQNWPDGVDQIVKIAQTGVWDLSSPYGDNPQRSPE